MASIVKRGNSFAVVYYIDSKPKWETCKCEEEAKKRKIEIEYEQSKGIFTPPSEMTVTELMDKFISSYGKLKWGFSAFNSNIGLIKNYILPLLGDTTLKNCTSKRLTEYFSNLSEQEAVQMQGRKVQPTLISDRGIYEVYCLLNIAFRLAVEWGDIGKNPLTESMKPSSGRGKRKTWDEETAKKALAVCEDEILFMYFHLALGCSMRVGEISGLQWSKVFLDENNGYENAHLNVDVQLSRISKASYGELARKKDQVKLVFPDVYEGRTNKTMLVLKTPKTESSIRTIYIPKTTASLLHQRKAKLDEHIKFANDNYQDFNLVMALDNGRPIEATTIGAHLDILIKTHGLPDVDFHSLRHTSTSVKLIISKGDIKSVQGDTGHSQAQMVTDTYAEIFDTRRKINAKKFDESFFSIDENVDCSDDEIANAISNLLRKSEDWKKVLQQATLAAMI